MAAPATADELVELVRKSGLVAGARLDEYVARRKAEGKYTEDSYRLAQYLVFDGLLTKYQAEQLLVGRWRNFIIAGKYKLLERLGKGGMAMVFLCEHEVMKRLVALKILPLAHAEDRELLGRFHREARALSQLRHPNIVGAHDVDRANKMHFLVMEYVDGGDLDVIVRKVGPLPVARAANYIAQAARGLQHAHESGLVHRDIKPGNLLVDRRGTVKLLDLGLARIFHETTDDLTTGRDAKYLLGTVDYLAPEQAINSHDVDIRADIYALGATFYYILAGRGMFEDGTIAQKLSWHMHRPPSSIREARPDVPEELAAVLDKMLAKKPEDRYQEPEEVVEALAPWTRQPIPPPTDDELPRLSRAARGVSQPSSIPRLAPTSISSHDPYPSPPSRVTRILPAEPPASSLKPPAASASAGPAPSPVVAARPRRRRRMLAGLIGGGIAVGVGTWLYLMRTPPDLTPPPPRTSGSTGNATPNPPRPTAAPAALADDRAADASVSIVGPTGQGKSFPTLREAVRAARSGDRVVVQGVLLRESIELSDVDGMAKDVIIEGIGPKGGPVRWWAPLDISHGRALLDVSGVEGLRIKGFAFEGQGKVAELIRLSGRGAGSTLEDLRVEGATRAGIVARGWSGSADRPAILRLIRFSTAVEAEAAVLFEPEPDRRDLANRAIKVETCRFVGPFQAALLVAGPVDGLDVERCRFHKVTDGLRYKRTDGRDPMRVRLANNTMVDVRRGLHFETTPPSKASRIEVVNNLFSAVDRLTALDRISTQPSRPVGRWVWTEEGAKSPSVPAGDRFFRKTFDLSTVPDRVTLDIGCDETFTAWVNGVEVAREPTGHFTQRVHAFDITPRLRRGPNAIAVKASNLIDRIDPRFGTAAGLMVQVVAHRDGRDVDLAHTDETWRYTDRDLEGWNQTEFDAGAWKAARPWPDSGATWPWQSTIWDSTVLPQLKPPLEPITVIASGNLRDYKSSEGYPTLDSERIVLQDNILPRNPDDDPTFLRLGRTHPLYRAGPKGTAIGVFEED